MLSLTHNEDGSALVEFGLVVSVFVVVIMGIIEVATIMLINSSLESGVIQASRYAITGSTTPGVTREEKVLQILNTFGLGLVHIDSSDLVTLVYPNFASIGQPEPFTDSNSNSIYDPGESFTDVNGNGMWDNDMGQAGLGGPGDIVLYRVNYKWGLLTGFLKPLIGDVTMTSAVAVRNEPY